MTTIYRRIGLGFQLAVSSTGGTNWVNLGGLSDLPGGDASKPDVDVTLYADQYQQFLPGQIDPGTWEFELVMDPQDTGYQTCATLFNATANSPVPNWKLTFPTVPGSTTVQTRTFLAYVNKLSDAYDKGKLVAAKIGLKRCGNPNFTST